MRVAQLAIVSALLVISAWSSKLDNSIVKRWEVLPPTPRLPSPIKASYAPINGIKLWYAEFPTPTKKLDATPLFFLHTGLANSDYWGLQVDEFRWDYHVYVMDSRGQGRSGGGGNADDNLTYPKLVADFVALLDYLKIEKASIVGWSDGAMTILGLLMAYPERVHRGFVFAQNFQTSGIVADVGNLPMFHEYVNRTLKEFEALAPEGANDSTKEYETVIAMWATPVIFIEAEMRGINVSSGRCTWIADGDHDEFVLRNQTDSAASWIPEAAELLIPQTSHFAFIQAPRLFNSLVRSWLNDDVCD